MTTPDSRPSVGMAITNPDMRSREVLDVYGEMSANGRRIVIPLGELLNAMNDTRFDQKSELHIYGIGGARLTLERANMYEFANGTGVVSAESPEVIINKEPVPFTQMEYLLMLRLAKEAGALVPNEAIKQELWPQADIKNHSKMTRLGYLLRTIREKLDQAVPGMGDKDTGVLRSDFLPGSRHYMGQMLMKTWNSPDLSTSKP